MLAAWNKLQLRLRTGVINRRDFIGASATLGVSRSLVDSALAQTPKRGSHLILGIGGASSANSLDPATWNASYMSTVGPQFTDSLVVLDEYVKPQPSLAESWEAMPGAKEWVFKLRKGVTFHNGKEFTATDVVYTINYHMASNSKSTLRGQLAPIAEVKATDKHEVTFELKAANADLPYLLQDSKLGIFPEHSNFKDGVGTGAFVLKSFDPGVRTHTTRNVNDWRKDRGYVDSVETLAINDPAARISALLSSSVHMINQAPTNVMEQVRGAGMQVFSIASTRHVLFAMRCDTAPYDNPDLRLALKYAIDRDAIQKAVLRGYGDIGNDQPIPRFDPFYAADIPQRPYDPDKARFHYKKSGYSGSVVLAVADVSFPGAVDSAQIFRQNAGKASIDLQVNRVPIDGYYESVWKKNPFSISHWTGYPTADVTLTQTYASSAPSNETHWRSPKFDELLVAARGELDTARRKQMYHDLQLMIHEDGGAIIFAFINNVDVAAKNVNGFVPKPVKEMSGYRAPESIWLAS